MSVEMTPCHLNHLINSPPPLGMGGAERLRRHGSGRETTDVARDCILTAWAPKSPQPFRAHLWYYPDALRSPVTCAG